MTTKKKAAPKTETFTPAEQRAARSARIVVSDAEPYGWMAHSESNPEQVYHLFRDPETKRLVCTCADFIFRGDAVPLYECKHVSAVLKYIGRRYLELEYDPHRQARRAA
jgi:hypothetical protein